MADLSAQTLKSDIRDILKDADLSSLSGKKVRTILEKKYDTDLSGRKKIIDAVLMTLLEETQNGEGDSSESEEIEEEDRAPPAKKVKQDKKSSAKKASKVIKSKDVKEEGSDSDVNDEAVAKRLQEEMNSMTRRTRGGSRAVPLKVKRVKDPKDKRPPKDCFLSPKLAAVMGSDMMPRSDVVKRVWEIVKERNLQDPKNGSFMLCDDELYSLFGRKRVRMFGMMKYLTNHIFRSRNEYDTSTC